MIAYPLLDPWTLSSGITLLLLGSYMVFRSYQ